jgi:O-antigen ligase
MTASFGGLHAPRLFSVLGVFALAIPTLIAFNVAPSSTLFNQAAALIGWGVFAVALAGGIAHAGWFARSPVLVLQAALGVALLCALAAPLWAHLPWSLALSNAGMVLAAMLAAQLGAALQREGRGAQALHALCAGLVAASIAGGAIALIQVYVPALADGDVIARSGLPGRAVGNMRQPNHLSSLLLWGVIAVVWLGETAAWRRAAVWGCALLFVFGVVLSGSRTGALGTGVLLAWALLDRRLSRPARWLLALMPLFYFAFWLGNAAWADATHHVFGGETRFSTSGDISSSRYAIWRDTLALIRMHPWAGVGFGEFNFAWTLTPFPDRPVAFFDHTHNLPLQLLVELGVPLGLAVLALLLWALWLALRGVMPRPDRDAARPPTAAFVIVLMIGLHSLLEYPLWYAYFLLPAAFAFGLCLGGAPRAESLPATPAEAAPQTKRVRPLQAGAMLLLAGGLFVLVDYMKVAEIFTATENAAPLAQRIAEGRRSWFFAHHADYAAATVAPHPSSAMSAFERAPHYLLDARLMQAWATALDEAGQTDKARYVAQRLKEFRNEQSAEFFAPCEDDAPPDGVKPFQCEVPREKLTYEDFR